MGHGQGNDCYWTCAAHHRCFSPKSRWSQYPRYGGEATISCSCAVLPFSAFLSFFFPIYIRKGTGKQQRGASLFLKITIQNCNISVFTGDICSIWHWIAYLVLFSFCLGTGWIEQRLLFRPRYHSYFCYGKRKVDGRVGHIIISFSNVSGMFLGPACILPRAFCNAIFRERRCTKWIFHLTHYRSSYIVMAKE